MLCIPLIFKPTNIRTLCSVPATHAPFEEPLCPNITPSDSHVKVEESIFRINYIAHERSRRACACRTGARELNKRTLKFITAGCTINPLENSNLMISSGVAVLSTTIIRISLLYNATTTTTTLLVLLFPRLRLGIVRFDSCSCYALHVIGVVATDNHVVRPPPTPRARAPLNRVYVQYIVLTRRAFVHVCTFLINIFRTLCARKEQSPAGFFGTPECGTPLP